MMPVKNIVETHNKILGVIDNQILLLKYEQQSGERWKEVHRNFILTAFFEPSSIDTIERTLYAVKIPGKFAVEYNVSLPTDVMSLTAPGSVGYLDGFIQGTHRNMPKYAPLELRRGIQEYHHIKNDFDFMEGNIFYFWGGRRVIVDDIVLSIPMAFKPGASVSLYYNL